MKNQTYHQDLILFCFLIIIDIQYYTVYSIGEDNLVVGGVR